MTPLPMRLTLIELIDQAMLSGARQAKACEAIELEVRTLQRWQSDKTKGDLRPQRLQNPLNALSQEEWAQLLSVLNSAEFGHLPPGQVVYLGHSRHSLEFGNREYRLVMHGLHSVAVSCSPSMQFLKVMLSRVVETLSLVILLAYRRSIEVESMKTV